MQDFESSFILHKDQVSNITALLIFLLHTDYNHLMYVWKQDIHRLRLWLFWWTFTWNCFKFYIEVYVKVLCFQKKPGPFAWGYSWICQNKWSNHSRRCWIVWFALHCNSLPPVVRRYPGAPRPNWGCSPYSLFLLSGAVGHSCHHLHSPPTNGLLKSFSRTPLLHPCPHHDPP